MYRNDVERKLGVSEEQLNLAIKKWKNSIILKIGFGID